MVVKKTDLAREAYRRGDVKEALRIAKTFRIGLSKDDRDKIVRAYECMVHPEFYRMIGKSPQEEIEKGKRVFEEKILGGNKLPDKYLYEVVSVRPEFKVETFGSIDELTAKYEQSGVWKSPYTREDLRNQPTLFGLVGPMYNGIRDGKVVIRYETPETYAALSI